VQTVMIVLKQDKVIVNSFRGSTLFQTLLDLTTHLMLRMA